jgi:hypothetical protein
VRQAIRRLQNEAKVRSTLRPWEEAKFMMGTLNEFRK